MEDRESNSKQISDHGEYRTNGDKRSLTATGSGFYNNFSINNGPQHSQQNFNNSNSVSVGVSQKGSMMGNVELSHEKV